MLIEETLQVCKATATNRTVIKELEASNMASSFTSLVIDFSDMPIGCLQAIWQGVSYDGDPAGANFKIKASCYRNLDTFDYVRGSLEDVTGENGARMWNLGVIGYRYALVEFTKGNILDGSCIIVASGKKS